MSQLSTLKSQLSSLYSEDKAGGWVVPGPGGLDLLQSSHKKLLRDLTITNLVSPPSTVSSTTYSVMEQS